MDGTKEACVNRAVAYAMMTFPLYLGPAHTLALEMAVAPLARRFLGELADCYNPKLEIKGKKKKVERRS